MEAFGLIPREIYSKLPDFWSLRIGFSAELSWWQQHYCGSLVLMDGKLQVDFFGFVPLPVCRVRAAELPVPPALGCVLLQGGGSAGAHRGLRTRCSPRGCCLLLHTGWTTSWENIPVLGLKEGIVCRPGGGRGWKVWGWHSVGLTRAGSCSGTFGTDVAVAVCHSAGGST